MASRHRAYDDLHGRTSQPHRCLEKRLLTHRLNDIGLRWRLYKCRPRVSGLVQDRRSRSDLGHRRGRRLGLRRDDQQQLLVDVDDPCSDARRQLHDPVRDTRHPHSQPAAVLHGMCPAHCHWWWKRHSWTDCEVPWRIQRNRPVSCLANASKTGLA